MREIRLRENIPTMTERRRRRDRIAFGTYLLLMGAIFGYFAWGTTNGCTTQERWEYLRGDVEVDRDSTAQR